MKKRLIAAFAATISLAGTAAFAQASDAMSNGSMAHDSMSKNAMSHDSMSKDSMSHKKMSKKSSMKKHDAMGMDHAASGAMSQ
ncbi:pentapeptide MXKDX repeat protein [Paraburkholderia silvatlantica]|uniref:pentapeptide MXKDX repeat protein n=1 Tax=Paraburkholderia silvatlantica TaxID=321895 RepID=UPI003750BCB9